MHDAVCAKCGANCQVPFRPTQGKDVFCSKCFESNGPREPRRFDNHRPAMQAPVDLREINDKLNRIIKLLTVEKPELG